ncbi:hypothetical protein ABGB07_42370 [Micromonosporaceae bacterium B7E4]
MSDLKEQEMYLSGIYYSILLRIPEVAVPKPGGDKEIPTVLVTKVEQAMSLIAWAGTAAGVVGVLITGGAMAISHKRGEGSEHMSRLGMVLGGCVLVATAGPIVEFFF